MEEKVLTTYVRGIYCRQCPEWIVDDLLHTRGVLDAAVSFWRAELTVRYDPQIVTEAELRRWHALSGLPLKRFFNTSGLQYKALALKDKLPGMSEDEQFALLATDGMLVKRPILITETTVLPGFREPEWAKVLGC
mgnify:CR=1 FL=1